MVLFGIVVYSVPNVVIIVIWRNIYLAIENVLSVTYCTDIGRQCVLAVEIDGWANSLLERGEVLTDYL